jgi:hypothetical protein
MGSNPTYFLCVRNFQYVPKSLWVSKGGLNRLKSKKVPPRIIVMSQEHRGNVGSSRFSLRRIGGSPGGSIPEFPNVIFGFSRTHRDISFLIKFSFLLSYGITSKVPFAMCGSDKTGITFYRSIPPPHQRLQKRPHQVGLNSYPNILSWKSIDSLFDQYFWHCQYNTFMYTSYVYLIIPIANITPSCTPQMCTWSFPLAI